MEPATFFDTLLQWKLLLWIRNRCGCGPGRNRDLYTAPPGDVQQMQTHLARGEAGHARTLGVRIRASLEADAADGVDCVSSQVETWATFAVTAAACGFLEEARADVKRACDIASEVGPAAIDKAVSVAVEGLGHRVALLMEQRRDGQKLLCGPLWRASDPPVLSLPERWRPWASAMPVVADYVGPVEVRWFGEQATGERGLYAKTNILAGDVLLVSRPLAQAATRGGDMADMVEAMQKAATSSSRARRQMACLADGVRSPMAPEIVNAVLSDDTEELIAADSRTEREYGDLFFRGIIDHNVFTMDKSWAAVYGMPSMLNHCCDGRGANALKLVLPWLDGVMVFRAARDIVAGEELCHRYFDVEPPLHDRHKHSTAWEFECRCPRCLFEMQSLPDTNTNVAVKSAHDLFESSLRPRLRDMWGSRDAVASHGQHVLQLLLHAISSVETTARSERGWGDAQLAWSLALIQPLSNAALWCLISEVPTKSTQDCATGTHHEQDALSLKCDVLRRIVFVWSHTESFGFDHLQNLYLLWKSVDDLRLRAVARAAMLQPIISNGPLESNASGNSWPHVVSRDVFLQSISCNGLSEMLRNHGGIIKVRGFLPDAEALDCLNRLESLSEDQWSLSTNRLSNDAEHRFWRYDGHQVDAVKKAIIDLMPGMHPYFHAARYDAGGKITLHNDAAQRVLSAEEVRDYDNFPEGTEVFRKVAVICYLTKDWREEYGGCFVDNLKGRPVAVVPEFNSLVAFLVPREHWVTEVQSGSPLRYTIFGWFHDKEQYLPGSVPKLGAGNEGCSEAVPPSGIGHVTSLTSQERCASAEIQQANQARAACEHGFRVKFGIEAEELLLGQTGAVASAILKRLKGS